MTRRHSVPGVWAFALVSSLAATAASCSGDGSSASASASAGKRAPFPKALTLASPLDGSRAPIVTTSMRPLFPEWLVRTAHASGTYGTAFAESTRTIDGVLEGTASVTTAFDANAFGRKMSMTRCFGPTMYYANHVDGPSGASGQLPQGDLGLWAETEASSGDACAAAQLNALLESDATHAQAALVALAAMARVLGAALPAAGASSSALAGMNALGISGVTFTQATLSLNAAGSTWSYQLDFTTAGPHAVSVTMNHTPGSSADAYSGSFVVKVDGEPPFPNCTTASTTDALATRYVRSAASAMTLASRRGTYCATALSALPATLLGSDGLLDPSVKWPSAATGWGGNFGRFGASFDPSSSTMQGDYAYAWQAGPMDRSARVFNIRINGASQDGEAFFGFGDDIETTNGTILGLICNWAGPGSRRTLQTSYAQRQFVAFDASTGLWRQPAGGSDIRYAPTNDCQYTNAQRAAGGSFWYDRDLTGSTTGSASQANLIVDSSDTTYSLDLFSKGTSSTIADAITARGGRLPPSF